MTQAQHLINRPMDCTENSTQPAPNVLLIIGMAAGLWALMYVGAASIWSWGTKTSDIAIERPAGR
jgi:hypothetical protein